MPLLKQAGHPNCGATGHSDREHTCMQLETLWIIFSSVGLSFSPRNTRPIFSGVESLKKKTGVQYDGVFLCAYVLYHTSQ